MVDAKQVIAKLKIIEGMAPEVSVKELCKVMEEFIENDNKSDIGFINGEADKSKTKS
jgi:hypothetical protein